MHLFFAAATAVLIFLCLRGFELATGCSALTPKGSAAAAVERQTDDPVVFAVYVRHEQADSVAPKLDR